MSHKKSEFAGDVMTVRAVEDCIRATKKYTEGIGTFRVQHPVQGEEFLSKVFCKYYEVYPDVDVSHMSAGTILEWLTGYKEHIEVVFRYDYRSDKGSVVVVDGMFAVKKLANSIPKFSDALTKVIMNGR